MDSFSSSFGGLAFFFTFYLPLGFPSTGETFWIDCYKSLLPLHLMSCNEFWCYFAVSMSLMTHQSSLHDSLLICPAASANDSFHTTEGIVS